MNTIKIIQMDNEKELEASVQEFSDKYDLGWIVDNRCVQAILSDLQDAINEQGSDDAEIEPAPLKRDANGHVITLSLANLRGLDGTLECRLMD